MIQKVLRSIWIIMLSSMIGIMGCKKLNPDPPDPPPPDPCEHATNPEILSNLEATVLSEGTTSYSYELEFDKPVTGVLAGTTVSITGGTAVIDSVIPSDSQDSFAVQIGGLSDDSIYTLHITPTAGDDIILTADSCGLPLAGGVTKSFYVKSSCEDPPIPGIRSPLSHKIESSTVTSTTYTLAFSIPVTGLVVSETLRISGGAAITSITPHEDSGITPYFADYDVVLENLDSSSAHTLIIVSDPDPDVETETRIVTECGVPFPVDRTIVIAYTIEDCEVGTGTVPELVTTSDDLTSPLPLNTSTTTIPLTFNLPIRGIKPDVTVRLSGGAGSALISGITPDEQTLSDTFEISLDGLENGAVYSIEIRPAGNGIIIMEPDCFTAMEETYVLTFSVESPTIVNATWMDRSLAPRKRVDAIGGWVNGKLYVYGGLEKYDPDVGDDGSIWHLSDMWEFDPNTGGDGTWTKLEPSGTPPCNRLYGAAAAVDSDNDYIYVFGGYCRDNYDNRYDSQAPCRTYTQYLYVYDVLANTWTEKQPSIASGYNYNPDLYYRWEHSFVWINGKGYVFGGDTNVGPCCSNRSTNEVWEYDPTIGSDGEWDRVSDHANGCTVDRPPLRKLHRAVVGSDQKMYIMGGWSDRPNSEGCEDTLTGNEYFRNDVWVFDPSDSSWTMLVDNALIEQGITPPPRHSHGMVWGTDDRLYIFSGYSRRAYSGWHPDLRINDLWAFDPGTTTWTELCADYSLGVPVERQYFMMEAASDGFYIFGGWTENYNRNTTCCTTDALQHAISLNDVWFHGFENGCDYTYLQPSNAPEGRYQHTLTYGNGKLYVFGGASGTAKEQNTERYHAGPRVFNPGLGPYGTWLERSPTSAPPPRSRHGAVFTANQLFIFGGSYINSSGNCTLDNRIRLNDLWSYSDLFSVDGNWTKVQPTGTPPTERDYPGMAADLYGNIYIFGGVDRSGAYSGCCCYSYEDGWSDDMYVYNPSIPPQGVWELRQPSNPPYGRSMHGMVYGDGKIYVYGGYNDNLTEPYLGDFWVYDPYDGFSGSWQLIDAAPAPGLRYGMGLAWYSGKLYFYGGFQPDSSTTNDGYNMNDFWEYDPATGIWTDITPASTDPQPYHKRRFLSLTASDNALWLFGGHYLKVRCCGDYDWDGGNPDLWVYGLP